MAHWRGWATRAHLFSFETDAKDPELSRLLKALAVAGFCAMNIMLLSVSVWFGADEGTRQAFHLVSASLAFPAILYSGRIFYLSAWSALRHGRTNMDVPISIGVTLAFGLSLYDTLHGAPHAYFDAATTLLFFLLIGRTLDHLMREKARSAVSGLAKLAPVGATVVHADGARQYVPITAVEPGAILFIAPGDRIPVDGVVEIGKLRSRPLTGFRRKRAQPGDAGHGGSGRAYESHRASHHKSDGARGKLVPCGDGQDDGSGRRWTRALPSLG